jgi:uncharacterized protein with FMN-binding domain
MRLHNKITLTALTGVSVIGALAGCSSTPATSSTNESATTPEPSATTTTAPTAAAGTSTYKDGTYTEDGAYQSPAGEGEITVTITLASDVVTAVKIDGHATDATAKNYQSQFENGIAGKVVGKKIDQLDVTKVAGSSLTSGGFHDAIKKIEAEAVA